MASGWGVGGNRSAIWADDDALFGQPLAPRAWLAAWARRLRLDRWSDWQSAPLRAAAVAEVEDLFGAWLIGH